MLCVGNDPEMSRRLVPEELAGMASTASHAARPIVSGRAHRGPHEMLGLEMS